MTSYVYLGKKFTKTDTEQEVESRTTHLICVAFRKIIKIFQINIGTGPETI